jgi:signal transduction histidine kinase
VDIILLDNKLPGIQGVEVLEYINKKQYDTVVMMITSYASLDLAVKATNMGAYNFVPKPFTPQELKAAIENITKHLFLKRMTRKMNREGKQLRFQFLSVLSHELKSPINAVEGYLKIMREKQAGENIDDYMPMIDRSLLRLKSMRRLIIDFLDLTKLESGKKSREIKNIDLYEIAKMALDTNEPLAIQKGVKFYFDADENISFKADAEEMEIIFNNLLSNAVKYNNPEGEVHFSISKFNGNIKIVVSDTGIGIDENDIPKLFREFSRIRNSKTKDITGTGLGLSIVKKIVDMYNGRITVESKPGKGTKFTIVLPEN